MRDRGCRVFEQTSGDCGTTGTRPEGLFRNLTRLARAMGVVGQRAGVERRVDIRRVRVFLGGVRSRAGDGLRVSTGDGVSAFVVVAVVAFARPLSLGLDRVCGAAAAVDVKRDACEDDDAEEREGDRVDDDTGGKGRVGFVEEGRRCRGRHAGDGGEGLSTRGLLGLGS